MIDRMKIAYKIEMDMYGIVLDYLFGFIDIDEKVNRISKVLGMCEGRKELIRVVVRLVTECDKIEKGKQRSEC